jgi:hypothetical protein
MSLSMGAKQMPKTDQYTDHTSRIGQAGHFTQIFGDLQIPNHPLLQTELGSGTDNQEDAPPLSTTPDAYGYIPSACSSLSKYPLEMGLNRYKEPSGPLESSEFHYMPFPPPFSTQVIRCLNRLASGYA